MTLDRNILDELRAIVGAEYLLTGPEERECYSFDGSATGFLPDAVCLPAETRQVSAILRLASRHRIPVVPRGAGSNMTGGSLAVRGGLVLAMNRMDRILEIDAGNMITVVEPGVITGHLQRKLARLGLVYPPDPASLNFCTLGGNAAECAGGPSAVKYGVTRDYIIGCQAVLADGTVIETGVRTEKGVSGYDLTRLLIGSEGTLAVFTRLILRLLPAPESRYTFLLLFGEIDEATTLVAELLASGLMPCTMEYMDRTALSIVRDRIHPPLPADCGALLLVELDGDRSTADQQRQRLHNLLAGRKLRISEATDQEQRQNLWQARRSVSPAAFALKPDKLSEDVVVPRSRIPDLVRFLEELARRLELTIFSFGHAGDGNIHVNIMLEKSDAREAARGEQARKELFDFVLSCQGTLSGEHGIGLSKAPFLAQEIPPDTLRLMQKIKQLFDPLNILNPGKIFPPEEEKAPSSQSAP